MGFFKTDDLCAQIKFIAFSLCEGLIVRHYN